MTTRKAKPTTLDDDATTLDDEVHTSPAYASREDAEEAVRDAVIEWLRGHGFAREAESVLKGSR
jgi:hypothetical protein